MIRHNLQPSRIPLYSPRSFNCTSYTSIASTSRAARHTASPPPAQANARFTPHCAHRRRRQPLPYSSAPRSTRTMASSSTPSSATASSSVALVEEAKKLAAVRAVEEHFSPSFEYVGIGSGTTIIYVIEEIARRLGDDKGRVVCIPTGYQSKQAILAAGLRPMAIDSLPEHVILDVAFDGADEVDEDLNCIKGGGACLFQEKLVAERAKKFVCVADYRKLQPRLLTAWPTIPIEVAPIAAYIALSSLTTLGSTKPKVRTGLLDKTGPLKTDQDFFIVDAPFPHALLTESDVAAGKGTGDGSDGTWEVKALSRAIKAITGVLDVGLFCGIDGITASEKGDKKFAGTTHGGQKPVAVYFGMQDGSVEVRTRKGGLEKS